MVAVGVGIIVERGLTGIGPTMIGPSLPDAGVIRSVPIIFLGRPSIMMILALSSMILLKPFSIPVMSSSVSQI